MSKKQKILFGISIAVNILLVIVVASGYIKTNFASEQLLLTEVQDNLVELEGLIAHQIENDWSEPNLVTVKIGDVMTGLWIGMQTGEHLNSVSSKDKQLLNILYYQLKAQYPYDELYSFTDVSEKNIEHLTELRELLRDVGLGMNISRNNDMSSFMDKVKSLVESIEGEQKE
ncbi:hypothetical protein [Bacillus solitudinis]|uniref:hypothetical protein n=1 Tax=Bacillus solitudinis TaxID=2014074 RepID=UPI000C24B6F1|nr:hypothetical protein [Bacillus solitudinis]